MSRIGKKPLKIPVGVQVKLDGNRVNVKGPKGQVERKLHTAVKIAMDGDVIKVALNLPSGIDVHSRQGKESVHREPHESAGTYRRFFSDRLCADARGVHREKSF